MSPLWLYLIACATLVVLWLPVYVVLTVADPARPRRYHSVTFSVNRSLNLHGRVHGTLRRYLRRRDLPARVDAVEAKVEAIFKMMRTALDAADLAEPVPARPPLRLVRLAVCRPHARAPPGSVAGSLPPGTCPVRCETTAA